MKKDIPVLIDAIVEAHFMALGDGRFAPKFSKELGRLVTHCNESVNFIAKRMGCNNFDQPSSPDPLDALLANDQHEFMEWSKEWEKVEMPKAQELANEGALVVASIKNPSGPGHVIVLRPGVPKYSGTWKCDAPKCLNVGGSVFLHKKASWAFRHPPIYFVWRGE